MCKSVHPTEVYVPTVFFIENIYCFDMLVNTMVEGIKDSEQPNLTLLLFFLILLYRAKFYFIFRSFKVLIPPCNGKF